MKINQLVFELVFMAIMEAGKRDSLLCIVVRTFFIITLRSRRNKPVIFIKEPFNPRFSSLAQTILLLIIDRLVCEELFLSFGARVHLCTEFVLWVNLALFVSALLTDIPHFTHHNLAIINVYVLNESGVVFRGYGHLLITFTAFDHHMCFLLFTLQNCLLFDTKLMRGRGSVTWLMLRQTGEFGTLWNFSCFLSHTHLVVQKWKAISLIAKSEQF